MNDFNGFEIPKSNYSKLPHAFIGELHRINSLAELKVILYVLRHTWGYGDANKKITNDEFCNGRKSKNGVRLDKGCGLSPKSIRSGVQSAMEHGYIIVEVDGSDPARQKHYYSLVMIDDSGGEKVTPENDSGGEKVTPGGGESNHRTEKETLERKKEEEEEEPSTYWTQPRKALATKALRQNGNGHTPDPDGDLVISISRLIEQPVGLLKKYKAVKGIERLADEDRVLIRGWVDHYFAQVDSGKLSKDKAAAFTYTAIRDGNPAPAKVAPVTVADAWEAYLA